MERTMGWPGLSLAVITAVAVLSIGCGAGARAPAGGSAAPTAGLAPGAPGPAAPAAISAPTGGMPSQETAGSTSGPAPLSPIRDVKVGVLQNNGESGLYLALEHGYFHQEGINVEVVPFADAAGQIAALSNNELQFATGAPSAAFFNAAGRDLGMRLVAAQMEVAPDDRTSGLFVRKELLDSGRFKGPSDLRGLRIGYLGPGQVSAMFLERIATQGGLSLADFELVQIGVPDTLPALANDKLDGAWMFEPLLTTAQDRGLGSLAVPIGQVITAPANLAVLIASGEIVSREPEVIRRFVTAHLRGQREYYRVFMQNEGDKDEVIRVLTKYTLLKQPEMWHRVGVSRVDPNGAIDETELGLEQDYFLRVGAQAQKVDLDKLVDRSYVNYALQRLGRMP